MTRLVLTAAVALTIGIAPLLAAAAPNPCALIATGAAAKALNGAVTSAVPSTTAATSTCTYHTASIFPNLLVTIEPLDSPAQAAHTFRQMTTDPMLATPPSVALAGIGDEAHRIGQMIYVRKGATIYAFSQVGKDANGAGALRTIALAKTAVAHLH